MSVEIPTERWDSLKGEYVDSIKARDFLAEIIAVCRKHGFSIGHEDTQGGFLIHRFDEDTARWLADASIDLEPE